MGANSDGFARWRFHRERVCRLGEKLARRADGPGTQTLYQSPPMHPDLEAQSGCRVPPGLEDHAWAVSAINSRPAGTAPKQSNQRRASSLSSTCRWPNGPGAPTTTFRHAQITAERAESIRPKGTKTGATHSRHSLSTVPGRASNLNARVRVPANRTPISPPLIHTKSRIGPFFAVPAFASICRQPPGV